MKKLVRETLKEAEYSKEDNAFNQRRLQQDQERHLGDVNFDPAEEGERAAKQDNYKRMDILDNINAIEPAIVALKGILINPDNFDTEFISDITDAYMILKDKLEELEEGI